MKYFSGVFFAEWYAGAISANLNFACIRGYIHINLIYIKISFRIADGAEDTSPVGVFTKHSAFEEW